MNTVKVIVTCFVPRDSRPSHGPDRHGQDLPNPDSVLQMVKRTVEVEKEVDAGIPMDTIIVNNDTGFVDGREFLDSIDETPTKNGNFKVIHRENYGRSFGGYDHAFEEYKDKYEYWIFSEDDMYYSKDGYANEHLNILNNNENCAFVATIGIGRPSLVTKHAHGGCGLTHRDYMEQTIPLEFHFNDRFPNGPAFKSAGSLAYTKEDSTNTRIHCLGGEVPFTYSLVRLGYDILVPENPEQWYKYHF